MVYRLEDKDGCILTKSYVLILVDKRRVKEYTVEVVQ